MRVLLDGDVVRLRNKVTLLLDGGCGDVLGSLSLRHSRGKCLVWRRLSSRYRLKLWLDLNV